MQRAHGSITVQRPRLAASNGGPKASARGLTLIELMVSLALLALLLGLAIPAWQGFVLRRQVDGLSAQLTADLHYLRTSTVARNQTLRLSLHASSACYLIHTGHTADCRCQVATAGEIDVQCTGDAQALRAQAMTDGSWQLRANVSVLTVDPRHGTFSPTGSLDWTHPSGLSLRHVVNILGRTRLCTPGTRLAGISAC